MAKVAKSASERALQYVKNSTRIKLGDLRDNPGARTSGRQITKAMNQAGHTTGELTHAAKPPLGWIWGDFFKPWQRLFPSQDYYNADVNLRREYPPLSLLELQRLIDLGWLNTNHLIDLTALCNTRRYHCDPQQRQFGVQLTDEGADIFAAKINLEVQWASETAIAAVEKAGGRIRTAYYDPISLMAAVNPKAWFEAGEPIPIRKAPPVDLVSYYSNSRNRGYMADPGQLTEAEYQLSQQMGYERPESSDSTRIDFFDPPYKFTDQTDQWESKRPEQIFVGLDPGSLVSLVDREVYEPTHPVLRQHYGKKLEDGTLESERIFRRERKEDAKLKKPPPKK